MNQRRRKTTKNSLWNCLLNIKERLRRFRWVICIAWYLVSVAFRRSNLFFSKTCEIAFHSGFNIPYCGILITSFLCYHFLLFGGGNGILSVSRNRKRNSNELVEVGGELNLSGLPTRRLSNQPLTTLTTTFCPIRSQSPNRHRLVDNPTLDVCFSNALFANLLVVGEL